MSDWGTITIGAWTNGQTYCVSKVWKSIVTGFLLPRRSQRIWERLDNMMIARLRGRRLLDIIRGVERRGLLPKKTWAYAWAALVSRLALRRVDTRESGGGQLIVAHRRDVNGSAVSA